MTLKNTLNPPEKRSPFPSGTRAVKSSVLIQRTYMEANYTIRL